MSALIHPTYFPSVAHWVVIAHHQEQLVIESQDNYQKQTYRNRAYIYSPNGKQLLSIPIVHTKSSAHQKYNAVTIEDCYDWKKQHWKSIETAYRTSPYFEFYEDELKPFFKKKHHSLFEMNLESMELIAECMQLEPFTYEFTSDFQPTYDSYLDKRSLVNAKTKHECDFDSYVQVFDDKHGFIPNLSILDLLFNEGPNALSYVLNLDLNQIP
ncbi:WbqC family protein [Galbibacter sp.]|jgi:hypothetical protein|uniref:WbqC family protein n=1 Tax=Galbibacter sp. TaxID=2918471 RepID=UPI003A8CE24B